MLVRPNNNENPDDDWERHRISAVEKTLKTGGPAEKNLWIIVRPIFPRPSAYSDVCTHAWNPAAKETKLPKVERLDRQLVAMIDDDRVQVSKDRIHVDPKVLMWSFSTSGSFVKRFAMLHPAGGKASAIGAPGGWMDEPTEAPRIAIFLFRYMKHMQTWPLKPAVQLPLLNEG